MLSVGLRSRQSVCCRAEIEQALFGLRLWRVGQANRCSRWGFGRGSRFAAMQRSNERCSVCAAPPKICDLDPPYVLQQFQVLPALPGHCHPERSEGSGLSREKRRSFATLRMTACGSLRQFWTY
jgi:hypothetical protein